MQEFRLVMKQGPTVGKSFDLLKDVMTIGRDLSNDIIVNDAEMSRHHSRLIRQGSNYVVEDLGSTNGTFVNSTRTTGQVLLKAGDMVNLGDTVSFTFEMPSSSLEAATLIGNMGGLSTDAPRPANLASYTPPPPAPSISAEVPTSTAAPSNTNKLLIGFGIGCLVLVCCVISVAIIIVLLNMR
jgi:hypothetical protein